MFFVLSGFLITDILLREKAKYGKIETFHFLRSRFLRIWPALFVQFLFDLMMGWMPLKPLLGGLFFLGNIFISFSHLWSVSAEFQFYLFSPFLVKWMFKSEKPHMIVLGLSVFSILLNLAAILYLDPLFMRVENLPGTEKR